MPLVTNAEAADPTRTVTLRTRQRQAYNAMWQRIAQGLAAYIATEPDYLSESQRIAAFQRFAESLIADEMQRSANDRIRGLEAMLLAAYLQGINLANEDLRLMGVEQTGVLANGTLQPQTPTQIVQGREYQEELAALVLLALADWRGIQEATITQLTRSFGAGVQSGASRAELERSVRERIDKVGKNRTALLVATAIVGAVAAGVLTRLASQGVEFFGIQDEMALWQTAGDDRVCARCRAAARKNNGYGPGVYRLKDIRKLIPLHPRCRCRPRGIRRGR